ncbi:MAG: aminotransferase class IV, partial [Alphaproteobacteria bacterium]|nr:aminotransferase class IV [Alphaproteobacteria bacterium]
AFFVIDGVIHTPTPTCFLDGITRRSVMALAKKRQMQMVERVMPVGDLARASEVFVAGTAAEVTPVACIGEYKYQPGDITRTLMEDYNALVRMSPAEVAKVVA